MTGRALSASLTVDALGDGREVKNRADMGLTGTLSEDGLALTIDGQQLAKS